MRNILNGKDAKGTNLRNENLKLIIIKKIKKAFLFDLEVCFSVVSDYLRDTME